MSEVFEKRFRYDFNGVRVHTDTLAAESAAAVHAEAYTVGNHVVFGRGRYQPDAAAGRELLAHELTHVVQQAGGPDSPGGALNVEPATGPNEAIADRAAKEGGTGLGCASSFSRSAPAVQRKVELRDVGKGEQSGFARRLEFIDRLNALSTGLTYSLNGDELVFVLKVGGVLSEFDNQMKGFIDGGNVLPMRLTNRHGLLGDQVSGYHSAVDGDAWSSGYVDIDDMLAGSDVGLQLLLVHFLTERNATKNYARRIGSLGGSAPEFRRAHEKGFAAEVTLLRSYFGDPTIRFVSDGGGKDVVRRYRNAKKVLFRWKERNETGANQGVNADYLEVRTPDGKVHTPEEYLKILAAEKAAAASPPSSAPVATP